MVDSTHPTPLDIEAEDFLAHRPYYTRSHLSVILLHVEAIGLPYCGHCHDWHEATEDHTEADATADTGSAAVGTVLALAAWVAAMLMLSWCMVAWFTPAPPASATRVVPGATLPDVCHNIRGTQTILDTTTGHRFRVVKATPSGNVCRRVRHDR